MSLIDAANTYSKDGTAALFGFIRNVVSLAALTLSLTVSFQKDLAAQPPVYPWLLQVCWGSLAFAVIAGVVAQYEEVRLYKGMENAAKRALESGNTRVTVSASLLFRHLLLLMCVCFGVGILSLALYAILNL